MNMKKIFLFLCACFIQNVLWAQNEVTLRVGTPSPLQSVNTIKGSDVQEGQTVAFRVARDIVVDGIVAIPYGTPVSGVVTLKKKGRAWGYSGKIEVDITEMVAPYGETIRLNNGHIYAKGKGRGALAAVCAIFYTIPSWFIHGTEGEIASGYEVQASVAQVVNIRTNGTSAAQQSSGASSPQVQQATPATAVQQSVQNDYRTPPLPANAVITKQDGTKLNVIVHEVSQEEISYRKATNPNGPMYKVRRDTVREIQYQF